MGAWIEIGLGMNGKEQRRASHPSWVRGLKSVNLLVENPDNFVAPFMGAWIEIMATAVILFLNSVAPFMGAWIEIRSRVLRPYVVRKSHPSWVRGLK